MASMRCFLRRLGLIAACLLATSSVGLDPASAASPYGRPVFKAPAILIDALAGVASDDETVVSVSVGDVTGDGYPDIAANYSASFGDSVSSGVSFMAFHKVPGSPILFDSPSPPFNYEAGPYPGPVASKIADLSGDGMADLVRIDANGTTVRVQISNPFGYNPSTLYPMDPGVTVRALEIVDMDADGLLDVMLLGHALIQGDDLVLMLHGSGSGILQVMTPWVLRGLPPTQGFTIGKMNGDSLLDVVTWDGGLNVAIHLNGGSFSYLPQITITAAYAVVDAAIAAMDGDAWPDLALVHDNPLVSIHRGTASGTPTSTHSLYSIGYGIFGYGLRSITAADLDRSGTAELYISEDRTSPSTSAGTCGMVHVFDPWNPVNNASLSPGRNPGKVVAADLDRDGILDLVIPLADEREHDVAVLLGPVGQDKGIQLQAVGASGLPGSPAVGDWNRDGRPDLALSVGTTTRTWIGSGGGAFSTGAPTMAFGADRLYSADMNRDGRVDLIHAVPGQSGLQLGNGDGTFQDPTYELNEGLRYVRRPVVDMNRDGMLDLIYVDPISRIVGVEMGNGTGTLTGSALFQAGGFSGGPYDAAAGDLDLDGDPDLAVATGWGVRLLRSDGINTLTPVVDLEAEFGDYRAVAVGDLDRDGDLDVVACRRLGAARFSRMSTGLDIFYLDGSMNLVQKVTLAAAERLGEMLEVADVNRDGIPDIVCTSENDQRYDYVPSVSSVFIQSPPGVFQQRLDFAQGYVQPDGFAAFVDADGDRQPDIVSATLALQGGAPSLQILQANTPSGSWGMAGQQDFAAGLSPAGLACGDMNRDGRPDLVTAAFEGAVSILFGDGNGAFAVPPYSVPTTGVTDVALADFNRDGRLDVVAATEGGGVTMLLGQGAGGLTAPVTYNTPGPIRHIRVADFNRDGRPDVVAFGFPLAAYVFLSGNGGGIALHQTLSLPGPGYGDALAVGDFNRDGIDDLALATEGSAPTVHIAFGLGNGSFAAASMAWNQISTNVISGLAAADVNVDGKMDLIVALTDGDNGWPMILLYGDGAGNFPSGIAYPSTSNEADYFAVGYLDGDQWPDVVQSGLGGMSMRLGNGAGGFGPRSDPGFYSSPAGVIIADLDRDGMNDIAFNDAGAVATSVLLNSKANITAVATNEAAPRPARPTLAQNAPNPFNPRTSISFTVPQAGPTRLVIYDVRGRRVANLLNRVVPVGTHRVEWDGRNAAGQQAASGVYFYRLESAGHTVARRMVLMK